MKLKWQQAPIRTAWGDDMVVASVAIDNDHTLSLYCERDQAPKVEAMFAQRTWVEQPAQQEPVAWRYDLKRGGSFEGVSTEYSRVKLSIGENWIPLYTSPPAQRTWVRLTDEEIEQGCKESWVTEQAWQSAVWWAEAKLKEKNT